MFLFSGLILSLTVYSQPLSHIVAVRHSHTYSKLRLVVDMKSEKPPVYRLLDLKRSKKLVVDLNYLASINAQVLNPLRKSRLIKAVKVKAINKHHYQLVMKLALPVTHKILLLPPKKGFYNYRLIIDLQAIKVAAKPKAKPKTKTKHTHKSTASNHKVAVKIDKVMRQRQSKPLRDIVVIIDPGHGGKDPGASGPSGHHEKNVVLPIARRLYKVINSQPGFKAVLTRRGDYYVTLRGRLKFARTHRADMFVSVHADAFPNRQAHGSSVFALSERGATSEAARWIAKKENESELINGGTNVDLGDKSHMLRSVLIDLSQTATIGSSLQLGNSLISQLAKISRLHHKKVEQAAFVVLKSPDIPSVLVETGFMSNYAEEKRLISPAYQAKIASALLVGIKSYFWQRPPRNTIIAALKAGTYIHVVKKGEVLSKLAWRYGTDVNALKEINHISGVISPGKRLIIPKRRLS